VGDLSKVKQVNIESDGQIGVIHDEEKGQIELQFFFGVRLSQQSFIVKHQPTSKRPHF
jgi:uncharacterized membrane protein YcaP (DUF421 family)